MRLDAKTTAVLIQGSQRDLLEDKGAVSTVDIRSHVAEQHMVENITTIASTLRGVGAAVIHVLFVIEKGGVGTKKNAPMYENLVASGAIQRGSWGVEPIDALRPEPEDIVIEKARENPFYNTTLESVLTGCGVETLILVGALTSGGIEHTARHAADAGYRVLIPEDAVAGHNREWHENSLTGFLPAVAKITTTAEVRHAFAK